MKAGSKVSAEVTIDRSAGDTGDVEVALLASSWTRTDVCVLIPAGKSSASFPVVVSPVTRSGESAWVGAYATSGGPDLLWAVAPILPD